MIKPADKQSLEKSLHEGWHGAKEVGVEQKRLYLGVFEERVIAALTYKQFRDHSGEPDPRIVEAVKHPQVNMILVRGDIISQARSYLQLAKEYQLLFKAVSRPDLQGDIVLIVASHQAIDDPSV